MFLRNTTVDENLTKCFFLPAFFNHFRTCLKTLLHETSEALYTCVWVIDLGSVGYDGSRRYGRGYSGTQPEHSTRASTTTERESISITLADIACVVAIQQQLRSQNKFETTKTTAVQRFFFSDYDGRKQLVLRESESSLLVQRLGKPLRSSPGGSAFRSLGGAGDERLIAQPGMHHSFVSWSSKSEFCSVFPDSPMK